MSEFHVDVTDHLPEARRALAALTRSAQADAPGMISHALAELIKVRASAENRCDYCLQQHADLARAAGIDDAQIQAAERYDLRPFDEATQAALVLATVITNTQALRHPPTRNGRTPMADALRCFTRDEAASIIMTTIAINAWNRAMILAGTEPTPQD